MSEVIAWISYNSVMNDVPQQIERPCGVIAPPWIFAVAFYAWSVIWGLRYVYYWQGSLLDLLIPLAMCVTVGWWAINDSVIRGRPISFFVRVWFVLLAGIVVPAYCLWTRGWRGLLLVLLNGVAWQAVAYLVVLVGRMVAFRVPFGS